MNAFSVSFMHGEDIFEKSLNFCQALFLTLFHGGLPDKEADNTI